MNVSNLMTTVSAAVHQSDNYISALHRLGHMTQAMFPTNCHANFEQTFEMSQKDRKKEGKKKEREEKNVK